MNYNQALEYINNISKEKGMVFGLDTIKELLNRVGNPEKKLKVIHIAGTNGKGSVGTYLASVLDAAGYKTGRFYSPALFEYKEVFSISYRGTTKIIDEERVSKYITLLSQIREKMILEGFNGATAFEIETVMACMYMADENCDVCLFECGLGGQMDATNVFEHKIVDVITSIGMDHMNILGDTLSKIATQKCGIIKQDDTVVTSNCKEEILNVIRDYCEDIKAKLVLCDKKDYLVRQDLAHGIIFDDIKHNVEGIRLSMLGTYQIENAALALETIFQLKKLGFEIDDKDIKDGFIRAHFKGRFDIVLRNPLLIADGAHNEPAALRLKESVDNYFKDCHKIYVMGVFKDKEYDKILSIMSDNQGEFIACMSENDRKLDSNKLAKEAENYFKNSYDAGSISLALDMAVDLSKKYMDSVIICFGSLSIMKEIYSYADNVRKVTDSRIDHILNNPDFKKNLSIIEEFERKRIFCCHGLNHLLDVARISWILCLEKGVHVKKDVVYGAALLHDIGRAMQYENGSDHESCGAILANKILEKCGYEKEEVSLITNAIMFHNTDDYEMKDYEMKDYETKDFAEILGMADKMSRNCFSCKANDECKWPCDMKNKTIIY